MDSAKQARRTANARAWYGPMAVYRCPFCGGWHIGHRYMIGAA